MSVSRQPPLLIPQIKRSRPTPAQFHSPLQLNAAKRPERIAFVKAPTDVVKKPIAPAKPQMQVEPNKKATQPKEGNSLIKSH